MDNELEIDDKLDYFLKEVAEFMIFLSAIGEENTQVNVLNLTKFASTFYDENESRYNETQLVNQFMEKLDSKEGIKLYSQFKKFRENNPTLFQTS